MSAAHRRRHQVPDRREDDDNDDQPTPKLSATAALITETPAARLRALLSRVPNNKPILVPPRSDLLDSDVNTADDDPQPTSHISFARETLRDMFMHAMREPGDTPQKDKTPRPRRNSFDELDQRTRDRHSGKRKSLSDEELESLPSMSIPYTLRLVHNSRQVTFSRLLQAPNPCPYATDSLGIHKRNFRTSLYLHYTNVRGLSSPTSNSPSS